MIELEVCCGGFEDALAAYKGGARRIELNSALHLGGLTPSLGSLLLTKKKTDLKVIAMVRPRAAGFCYSEEDMMTMFVDAQLLLENGADGIAFGFLNKDCSIDEKCTKEMVSLIKSFGKDKEAVFHRAYDCTEDANRSAKLLIECGVDRILTSGLEAKANEGINTIKELEKKYGSEIEILAGSGLNFENCTEFINESKVKQIHSSCKDWVNDETTTVNRVSYSYHNEFDYDVVSEEKVRKLVKVINKI
ncbi:MAG: copper homeostasis protein CutC [Anaerorhabdus sp.]